MKRGLATLDKTQGKLGDQFYDEEEEDEGLKLSDELLEKLVQQSHASLCRS